MKRLWRLLAWAAVLAVAVVLLVPLFTTGLTNKPAAVATGTGATRGSTAAKAAGPIPVLFAKARASNVPVYVEGVGTGQALNSVLIRSQVDGVLMSLDFVEGQTVKSGAVIAKIDPRLYQAVLDQNVAKKALDEANLANAQRDLARYKLLSATKAVTQQQYDTQISTVAQAQAQIAIDQALIDSARTTLSYTNITSPIAGRTGIRNVDVGNLIHASDTTGIVTVSQIQPISIVFNVPQQELPRINKASLLNQLDVQALDTNGKSVVDHGVLAVVNNTIDATTGTVKLKANFPNPQLQLWPGIFVNVRLLVETIHNAVTIPIGALQRGPKGTFVFTVANDKAVMRTVTTSQQDDNQVVIATGLKADEPVITSGFQKLTDGAAVKASPDTSAPSDAPALHQQEASPPPSATPAVVPPRAGAQRRGASRRQSAAE